MEAVASFSKEERVALKSMKQMHDEAYLYLTNALTSEEQGSKSQALYLYSKGLVLVDSALTRYHGDDVKALAMMEKMRRTREHVAGRVRDLKEQLSTRQDGYHVSSGGAGRLYPAPARPVYPSVETSESPPEPPPPSYEQSSHPVNSSAMYPVVSDVVESHATPPSAPSTTTKPSTDSNDNLQLLSDHIIVAGSDIESNASKIFEIPTGVQIFFVSPSGYVSAPTYPNSLKIFSFMQETSPSETHPPAFLKIGEWTFPLLPGVSPILHSSYGAYMFPDLTYDVSGSSVGVIISDDIEPQLKEKFEILLGAMGNLAEEVCREGDLAVATPSTVTPSTVTSSTVTPSTVTPSTVTSSTVTPSTVTPSTVTPSDDKKLSTSEKVAKGLVIGAEILAYGMYRGAEKGCELIKRGSGQLRDRYGKPNSKEKVVDPNVRQSLQVAYGVTEVAVTVSKHVVTQLSNYSKRLADILGPEVRKQIVKYTKPGDKERAEGKITAIINVTAGAVQGFSSVYNSLEDSAKLLAGSLKDETVHFVGQKYGKDAGETADLALGTTGNILVAGHNVKSMGVKALAKRAGKDTAKATLNIEEKQIDHKK